MISLNDVLLAMSNIPVDDPIAEIWGRGLQGGYKIIEYTGSLPITISANGDALLDYRIYGADSGVGEPTENFWDVSKIANNEPFLKIDGGTLYVQCTSSASVPDGKLSKLRDYVGDLTPGRYTLLANSTGTSKYIYLSGANVFLRFGTPKQFDTQQELDSHLDSVVFFYASGVNTSAQISDMMFVKGLSISTSYIPYGYKLPMTVQSANLFDKNAQDVDKGFISKTRLNSDGTTQNQYNFNVSEYIAVRPETSYYFGNISTNANFGPSECFYDSEKNFISSYTPHFEKSFVVTTPTNAAYVRVSYYIDNSEQMITEGAEPPSTYIPYSRTDTPVYIGENQLDAIGEYRDYVDFGIQKIARKIREYTFTGNETFNLFAQNAYGTCWVNLRLYTTVAYCPINQTTLRSSHFTAINNSDANFWYGYPQLDDACNFEKEDGYDTVKIFFRSTANFSTAEECKAYFKEQYDNGTPVKIWFVMKYTVGQYESTDNGKEDPPVSLPEIPTIKGETGIDYDGTPKPSQMYVKYKGKG